MSDVIDHTARQRFELVEDGKLAFADYRLDGEVLILPHVEAHPDLRGKGTAGRLMTGVMEVVKERGYRVLPICGYAVAYIQRHPEYHHLLSMKD
jgi:predicted GNAT family acetyltransferase